MIVPEDADTVRQIFKTFLKEETLAETAKQLNDQGLRLPPKITGRSRSGFFQIDMVHHVLRNKAYIGVRVFSAKGGKSDEVKAAWGPIVDVESFERAQVLLRKNRHRKRTHLEQRYPFTLSGVCYCASCGDRMSGKSAHGRNGKVPYYEHARMSKHQAALSKKLKQCDPYRIKAIKIEPEVWREVKRFLLEEQATREILLAAKELRPEAEKQLELDRLKKKIALAGQQIETLIERISRLPKGVDESLFLRQLEKIQGEKNSFARNSFARNSFARNSFARMLMSPAGSPSRM